jgi:hypothetical protein
MEEKDTINMNWNLLPGRVTFRMMEEENTVNANRNLSRRRYILDNEDREKKPRHRSVSLQLYMKRY